MNKMNENGFVLIEAVIVGVFVMSLFTFLYMNVVPLVGRYEQKEAYDSETSVYNAHLIRMMILETKESATSDILNLNTTDSTRKVSSDKVLKYSGTNLCKYLYDKDNGSSSFTNDEYAHSKEFCQVLLGERFLNVKNIYVSSFNTTDLKKSAIDHKSMYSKGIRDYIKSIDKFRSPSAYQGYHRLIVEFNDGTYANIEVRA